MQEKTKKIMANALAILTMLFFVTIILFGEIETTPLESGDIQKSIDTGQYK